MKYVFVGLMGVGVVALGVFFLTGDQKTNHQTIMYEIEGNTYRLLIADTPELHEQGLMFVREANGFDGMIFFFEDVRERTFWNKNTFLDLQVYWMRSDTIVGTDTLPSIEQTNTPFYIFSPEPVDTVIEIIL